MSILTIGLQIMGSLGVFLYGMTVMGEGLQKAAGSRLRDLLSKATTNRYMGTLSGFVITCAVQSSSVTTVMVVAFSSAGLLTLQQSLGVIFGANIGTTSTAWIVSLLGFKVKISTFAVPLIGIGFFSQLITGWRWPHRIGQVMVGFGLLFLGLGLLKDSIPDVKESPAVMEWVTRLDPSTMGGLGMAIAVGAGITVLVQSSSASMAITLTAAAKGYIDFPTACAIALGQNIGTTVTAVLAAIGAPLVARRTALAHFLFNLLGSIWPIFVLGPFLAVVDALIPGDPYGTSEQALLVYIPTHIAAFHTAFNVANTALFLPLTPQFERLIVALMPERDGEEVEEELVYLKTALGGTPELALTAAQKEVDRMAGVTVKMIARIQQAIESDDKGLPRLTEKILNHENSTDVLEHKIYEFLTALVHGQLSTEASKETLSLMSMINDLERIGDHGETIARLLLRARDEDVDISEGARKDLLQMANAVDILLRATQVLILERDPDPMPAAREREDEVNSLRDRFRASHLERMRAQECSPAAGLMYNDMLTSFEKMGDHAFNIVEATAGIK